MDFSTILDTVTGGTTAIDGVVKTIKAIKDVVKKNPGAPVATTISEDLSKLLQQAEKALELRLSLFEAAIALKAKEDAFNQRVTDFDLFKLKAQDYEFVTIAEHSHAYAPKADVRAGQPMHYLCVKCFHRNCYSVLQLQARDFHLDTLECQECGSTVKCKNDNKPTIMVAPARRSNFRDDY